MEEKITIGEIHTALRERYQGLMVDGSVPSNEEDKEADFKTRSTLINDIKEIYLNEFYTPSDYEQHEFGKNVVDKAMLRNESSMIVCNNGVLELATLKNAVISIESSLKREPLKAETTIPNIVKRLSIDGKKFSFDDKQFCLKDIKSMMSMEELRISDFLKLWNVPATLNVLQFDRLRSLHMDYVLLAKDEFELLVGESESLSQICLKKVTVVDEDGNDVEIEKLIDMLPANIREFAYTFKKGESPQRINTLPSSLYAIHLFEIQHFFDLDAFAKLMRKNPKILYQLFFRGTAKYMEKVDVFEKKVKKLNHGAIKLNTYKSVMHN